jgi:colicin import membrane protein
MIPKDRYPGPGGMFALSFVCHLVVFSLMIWSNAALVFHPAEEPVTYVDMVTLPVASPQAGTPAPAEEKIAGPPTAPAPVSPPVATMALPAAKPKTKPPLPVKGKTAKPQPAPVEDSREFEERMAKIERQAEDKRQADVLARLKKGGGSKTVGMPGARGTQAGSDYSAYIQSRLKDAFRDVIASQTGAPQTLVRITIGTDGRITGYRVEKKSGDPVFDEAVSRAVTLAGRYFKPPPGGVPFERVFRFKPEGVGLP